MYLTAEKSKKSLVSTGSLTLILALGVPDSIVFLPY